MLYLKMFIVVMLSIGYGLTGCNKTDQNNLYESNHPFA